MRGTDTKRLPKRHLTYRLERIQENKSDKSEERRFRNLTDETNCLWRVEQFQVGDARVQAPPRTYGEALTTTFCQSISWTAGAAYSKKEGDGAVAINHDSWYDADPQEEK